MNLTFFLSFEPKFLTFHLIRSYQIRLWGTPYVISNISFNSSKKETISQLYQWVRKQRRRENEGQTLAGHSTSGLWSFASDLPGKCIIILVHYVWSTISFVHALWINEGKPAPVEPSQASCITEWGKKDEEKTRNNQAGIFRARTRTFEAENCKELSADTVLSFVSCK